MTDAPRSSQFQVTGSARARGRRGVAGITKLSFSSLPPGLEQGQQPAVAQQQRLQQVQQEERHKNPPKDKKDDRPGKEDHPKGGDHPHDKS